ncbi:MAG TPA: outer membrane lipoprotein chaperone LolA [Steroidobacteraceae bacterium]|nr:outer membrane lipoprotein chaperone LolA [Steroidobacteraceae bacterium]
MIARGIIRWCSVLLAAFACAGGVVADEAPSAAEARVESFFGNLETFAADFVQVLADRSGQVIDRSSGQLVIAKPWRFRWTYEEPATQLIVADGQRLWLYDRDLEQVTVRPIDATLAGTPAMLLSGEGTLGEEFAAQRIEERGNVTWIALVPLRPDSDFREVRLGFENDDELRYMELDDKLSQTTLLEFSNVEVNAPVDPERFEFEPPPGADVIGDVTADPPG